MTLETTDTAPGVFSAVGDQLTNVTSQTEDKLSALRRTTADKIDSKS
jgi:hypothetical protein